jgi:hypothetical protein
MPAAAACGISGIAETWFSEITMRLGCTARTRGHDRQHNGERIISLTGIAR